MNATEIKIEKLQKSEYQGDWHDKPLRWVVSGPSSETQKFSTKRDALKYASMRRRSSDQCSAIRTFCA